MASQIDDILGAAICLTENLAPVVLLQHGRKRPLSDKSGGWVTTDDPHAVEELFRFAGPLETATERYTREDVQMHGTVIPRGSLVFAALASANRDESRFADADRLDISRDPNPHVAFGLGPHYCLGAPLARLEAQIAVSSLVEGLPTLACARPPADMRWRSGLVLRGLVSLPLCVDGDKG